MRGVESPLGTLFQTVSDDALQPRADVLVGHRKVGWVLFQDGRHCVGGGVASEGALARKHLVEDGAEGEDVAARIGWLASHLLRRHVPECPEDDAGLRSCGRGREVGGLGTFLLAGALGQSEVEDLDPAVLRDEEVLRLQIPVNDPFLVSGGKPPGNLDGVVDHLARRESSSTREFRAQRLALQKLLDHVGRALVGSDVVDEGDVRMIECARRLRLLLETSQTIQIRRQGDRQHLDRDVPLQPLVPCPVHLPHPARAQRREDLVGPELRAGRQRHRPGFSRICRSSSPPQPSTRLIWATGLTGCAFWMSRKCLASGVTS